MRTLPPALAALASYPQFITYKIVPSVSRPGKTDKIPILIKRAQKIDAHNPANWLSFDAAAAQILMLGPAYGVGFVLTEQDPFFFVDLDSCYIDGKWDQRSQDICNMLSGAAVEVSSSGTGLHILGSHASISKHAIKPSPGLELYTHKRFVALTGTGAVGNAAHDCTPLLPQLIEKYFSVVSTAATLTEWTIEPRAEYTATLTDEELIEHALRSKSAGGKLGLRITFKQLWEADETALAEAYPDDPPRTYNYSYADLALAQHLAFWTGCNCERIEQLMWKSALPREKWKRDQYIKDTILLACGRTTAVYKSSAGSDKNNFTLVSGGYVNIELQQQLFKGCVYVKDLHAVVIPNGETLRPEQFRVVYGGNAYPLDLTNERTTHDAWKVVAESQALRIPHVNATCFRPALAPGEIIEEEGQRLINTWHPISTRRVVGDATPFLRHVALMLPDQDDQEILLSYMAACVQYPGIKFHWCPIIQGVEGNGKTLLSLCVEAAVGRRYSHFPKAQEIAEKYNDWLYGKLFIGVEDIYVPDSRVELLEILKIMIDRDRQEIRPMYGKKTMVDICCNFILNSNHKDAIRRTENDRRYATFYTAHQTAEDLKRDGLFNTGYFPALYRWLRTDGLAIVSNFLSLYKINPAYDPAGACDRAPRTSSTAAAIEGSYTVVEQEIIEATELGVLGFRGGWISSMQLQLLLERLGLSRRIPQQRRRDLLTGLGYIPHPGLPEGRVNNTILPDGGKPRLYIRRSMSVTALLSPGEISDQYTLAQASP